MGLMKTTLSCSELCIATRIYADHISQEGEVQARQLSYGSARFKRLVLSPRQIEKALTCA